MSFGTVERFGTKKALKDAVSTRGATVIMVRDTSMFNNRGIIPVSDLAGSSAVIVGPDVNTDRRWYANVKISKSGVITIA
jgi:hypothetical protein